MGGWGVCVVVGGHSHVDGACAYTHNGRHSGGQGAQPGMTAAASGAAANLAGACWKQEERLEGGGGVDVGIVTPQSRTRPRGAHGRPPVFLTNDAPTRNRSTNPPPRLNPPPTTPPTTPHHTHSRRLAPALHPPAAPAAAPPPGPPPPAALRDAHARGCGLGAAGHGGRGGQGGDEAGGARALPGGAPAGGVLLRGLGG